MPRGPSSDSSFSVTVEPQICSRCHTVSRLTNGLCLNCLLRGALSEETAPAGKEAFKEVLSAVQSRDGDWHIADHEILHEIARGGMGVVYQAQEPHSGRIVALKCVLAFHDDSDHLLARFRREAETAARLDHPNIVPIYQIGETADGFPYYTMKYAPGGSLLGARGPLRQHPRESVELMAKVARAVHYAHEHGVLHRDLKPGNILLDNQGQPMVSDFGLARCETVSGDLTRSLSSFGTPGYIAPEQADGPAANLTPAADIYSLGAILFELLTGRTPFVGDNAFAVMKQSADEPAPKVRSLAPRVHRDLEKICERCLEREPRDRYQSAAALGHDLEQWLAGEPISATIVPPWRRVARWAGRHQKLAAALSVVALMAAIAIGWQVYSARLRSMMHETVVASRSTVVLPFFDIDRVGRDDAVARLVGAQLKERLVALGPAQVELADSGPPINWAAPDTIRVGGRIAKARTVISGTIRNTENGKRISLRLRNAADGTPLFTKVLVLETANAPVVTDDLARSLYALISASDWSSVTEATADAVCNNPEAKEHILAGRNLLNRASNTSDCDGAIDLFRRALAKTPNSVLGHVYLSYAAAGRTHYNSDASFLTLAEQEADRALTLSAESGEAHRAKAAVYYQQGRFSDALEEEIKCIEFGGLDEKVANFIGRTLDTLGRPELALKWCEVPLRTPRTPGEVEWVIGDCWMKLGDDGRALEAYRRSYELHPDMPHGPMGISHIYLLQADFDKARAALRQLEKVRDAGESDKLAAEIEFFARDFTKARVRYEALAAHDPEGGGLFWGSISYKSALARIHQERGEAAQANDLLRHCLAREFKATALEPANAEPLYRRAAVEAMLGMPDAAFQHLRRAVELGWLDYRSFRLDPRFDSLRARPEFEQIASAMSNNVRAKRAQLQPAD
ncbi:MAG TPA: serine/threonine-protein kinase [Chthoniobacterales bacterium]|nr:serine/threonine-protein kinase [Chthoniobacterales bacterium]